MEDLEARRARLKAMREQVSQSVSAPDTSAAAPKLANPFEEAPPPVSDAHTPRFNYYSNPAAGFVPAKRKEPGPPARPRWSPDFYPPAPIPPPVGPLVGGFGSPIPLYNPMQPGFLPPPPALDHGDGTWPIKRPSFGPGRGVLGPGRGGFALGDGYQGRGQVDGYQGRGRGDGYQGRGRGDGYQGRGRGDGYQGRGGRDGYQGRGRGDGNQGRGGGDGYQGRGGGDGYQGRGGGDGYQGRGGGDGYQGRGGDGYQGRGRGRGRGEDSASARDRPDLFYHKSMVEDPWKHLL